jgi:hypothetical protein
MRVKRQPTARIVLMSTVLIALVVPAIALANGEQGNRADLVLFPWVHSGGFSKNWLHGLGFVGLGVVGALVTVYFLLGDFLPSMGGKAEYEELKLELDELGRRRYRQIEIRERFARGDSTISDEQLQAADRLTEDLGQAITQKQREIQNQKRGLLAVGLPIYVLLGGAFAVLFSSNGLQAFIIGFGWTGLADRIGLNRELDARSSKREVEIQKLREDAENGVRAQSELDVARAQLRQLAESTTRLAGALERVRQPSGTRLGRILRGTRRR